MNSKQTPVVYLARHATPDWTRTDIPYTIPPGPPLTAKGEGEAAALGEFLRPQGIVQMYASPFERTLRTAQIAAEIVGCRVIIAQELSEIGPGESDESVMARVAALWQRAGEESQEIGPITLVTHGGCVLSLLNHLRLDQAYINQYRSQFDHRNPLPPAGAWLTRRERYGVSWMAHLAFSPEPIQPALPNLFPNSTPNPEPNPTYM